MSWCATLDNSAMSLSKADLDVQWCSLIAFGAFQVSRCMHAQQQQQLSNLLCLVLKRDPRLLPACCMFVDACMLTLCG